MSDKTYEDLEYALLELHPNQAADVAALAEAIDDHVRETVYAILRNTVKEHVRK